MDADLKFCLKRFVDERLTESAKHIDQLQRNFRREQNKMSKTSENDATIYQQENIIVEQFTHDLNKNNIDINRTRQTIEKEFGKALDSIQADIETIAQVSTTRNNNRQDNEEIRMASTKIRQQIASIDSALTHLFNMIDFKNSVNCSSRIQLWLRQHYGYANELNRMFGKKNSSGDILAFSENGPFMHCILERVPLWKERHKLLTEFLRQMDEDSDTSKTLMDFLYHMTDVSTASKFIQCYIQDRHEKRQHRKEQLLHKMELELDQQGIEQQIRATELVNALCQLSTSLVNDGQLNRKFKKILNQAEASKQFVPILIDHSEEVTDLPLIIRLEAHDNKWTSNKSSIHQRFCSVLCETMKLPADSIRIEHIEEGSVMLHIVVRAPYGPLVIKKISGYGNDNESSLLNVQDIQKCCAMFDSRMHSMATGKYSLPIEKCLMDYKWNTMLINDYRSTDETCWIESYDQKTKESLCPEGWKRFGIRVAENDAVFNAKWGSWYVAYHGTQGSYASLILTSGLRVSTQRYSIPENQQSICLSPSIEYAAHPRHTRLWSKDSHNSKNYPYYQLVFQCRVNPAAVGDPKPETLLQDTYKTTRIDKDFRNEELEWIIQDSTVTQKNIRDNIVCHGLMIRVIDSQPSDLPILNWWKDTHSCEY